MVVKIQPAAKNIGNAVDYNERKMTGEEGILDGEKALAYIEENAMGHVLATVNVPDTSTLENEFNRLRMKNMRSTAGRKLQNPTFHMSINPGENDVPMDETTVMEFTQELMERLGYGASPYRVYRHDDTGRTHYHVVSTRIGQDGKKIKDSFENAHCESICRELGLKYGFVMGTQGEAPVQAENQTASQEIPVAATETALPSENPVRPDRDEAQPAENSKTAENGQKKQKVFIPPFKLDSEKGVTQQYAAIHKEAVTWSFTTPEQYGALLRWRFNTEAKVYEDEIYFIGLDDNGLGCTPPVKSSSIYIPAMRNVLQRCADTDIKSKKRQRERLEGIVKDVAGEAESWKAFRYDLQKKGVYLAISWTDNSEPFGVTWIDRGTKCIWKGSETGTDLAWIKKLCEDKGWKMSRHWKYEKKQHLSTKSKVENVPIAGNERQRTVIHSGSLSSISSKKTLKDLFSSHGIKPSQRSNADASRNGKRLKYGEEDNKIDVVI